MELAHNAYPRFSVSCEISACDVNFFTFRIFTAHIQMIYQIVTTVPFVTGAIRRLHDMGKTGWFMLLAFIPFIGWVALAMMLCTASNPEANRFGENPYEEGYYHL